MKKLQKKAVTSDFLSMPFLPIKDDPEHLMEAAPLVDH